jgi:hypothetical protein
MSMARAALVGSLLTPFIEAQPDKSPAETTAVLLANFRKSRLEIVDNSLPMAYLLSRFGEVSINNKIMSISRISIERINTGCLALLSAQD